MYFIFSTQGYGTLHALYPVVSISKKGPSVCPVAAVWTCQRTVPFGHSQTAWRKVFQSLDGVSVEAATDEEPLPANANAASQHRWKAGQFMNREIGKQCLIMYMDGIWRA